MIDMDARGDGLLVLKRHELNSTADRILSQVVFNRLISDLDLISCYVDIVLLIGTVLVNTVTSVFRVLHVVDANTDRDRCFILERCKLEPTAH